MFNPLDPTLLFLLHTSLTCFMTGLIWFVQLVHYPLFATVGRETFVAYEREHMRRVSWIVGPAMLAEAVSAAALVWLAGADQPLLVLNFGLIAVTWLSTALWQVPRHECLRNGFDAHAADRLVQTNWVRTLCWTARCILLLYSFPAVVAMIAFAPSGSSPR
ncbi:MAG: hypothetical protein ABI972_03730 [Acidobacteriota bacterium]